jgi:hypothetical protein
MAADIPRRYTAEEVGRRVATCVGILFKADSDLLENEVNERSISHKLAEYLQPHFPDWNVDCEYNRKGPHPKVLEGISECSEQKKTDRIYPDIIIHRRNTDHNLLVIEMKYSSDDPCDLKKLELLTATTGGFRYVLGLFLRLDGKAARPLRWFMTGQEIADPKSIGLP